MLTKQLKTPLKLLDLLEKVKGYRMTPEERRAQRRSWVIGELMLANPEMTRDEACAIYDRNQ